MESVFFYEKNKEKGIFDILKNDDFMRISRVIRESNVIHGGKTGYILYLKGGQEEIDSITGSLKDKGAEKISGAEEKTIIDTLNAEEENSACGIGLMFA